jgi:transposase
MGATAEPEEPTKNTCPDCGAIMKPVTLGDRRDPSASIFECTRCGRRLDSATGVVNR